MRKNSFGENVVAFLAVIGIFVFIGMIGQASEPKCIKSGCDNKQASGSSYCYLHKPYSSKSSSSGTSVYSNKTSGSSSKSSSGGTNSYTGNTGKTSSSYGNSSTKKSTTTKKKTYESYDDGYDDIYMDRDYDYDRYCTDSDYADGVDDAMDEFGEDW